MSAVAPKEPRFGDPENGPVDDIVDLGRYPIDRPGTGDWDSMVATVRDQLAADGCVRLAGFVLPRARERARAEIARVADRVAMHEAWSSVYSRSTLESELAPDDPRRLPMRHALGHVTRDQIAPDTVVSRLYVAPSFKAFVAAILGLPRVFEYADPLAGLIATIIRPGDELGWHYDTNECVVSLMTQRPDAGGLFEFCPNLRTPGDENVEGLGRVLRGEADELIHTRALETGDLQIFQGRYSLHRVTTVGGATERHVACLGYADRPGVIGPVDRTRAVYGRVTEAHLVAEQFGPTSADGLIL